MVGQLAEGLTQGAEEIDLLEDWDRSDDELIELHRDATAQIADLIETFKAKGFRVLHANLDYDREF